jgi:XTP/dITP diphosphohydrolase
MPITRLLLATTNPGKLTELLPLLDGLGLVLVTPADLGLRLEVEENGATYAENAGLKAAAFCAASGLPCLADDSGLEVDALDGRPGLHSARFSPIPGASDADRRRRLLEQLAGRPRPWTARFRCVVALAIPGQALRFAEGICPGEIIPQERGAGGFGYDPVFLLPELGRTMAELPMEEKNRLSHRARAVLAARAAWLAGPEALRLIGGSTGDDL